MTTQSVWNQSGRGEPGQARPEIGLLPNEEIQVFLVKLCEFLQLHHIDPPLPRFAFGNVALGPAELHRHLHLGESRRLPCLAEPPEEQPIRRC